MEKDLHNLLQTVLRYADKATQVWPLPGRQGQGGDMVADRDGQGHWGGKVVSWLGEVAWAMSGCQHKVSLPSQVPFQLAGSPTP